MGLDMYLYAAKRFALDSDEATKIFELAKTNALGLEQMALQDPMEHETDIYLSRWNFEGQDVREHNAAIVEVAGLTPLTTPEASGGHLRWVDGVMELDVAAIYWRKANAVHNWFVQTVQAGVDECQIAPVHPEQLALLRALCVRALAAYDKGDITAAAQVMTPTPGFFFGSTDIDQWWAEDIRHTVLELDRVVTAAIEIGGVTFSYHSSW